jgi:uncharacterized protein (TIGR02265 family)
MQAPQPPTPPLSSSTGVRAKAGVLLARLTFIREAGVLAKVLARLPPDDAKVLRGTILPIAWYPLELHVRLDHAIAEVLSADDPERVFRQMGRASARTNLAGPHRNFLRPGDPHAMLANSPSILRVYYDQGHRTYERTGERAAVLRTYDVEGLMRTECLTNCGWHEAAIELCGGCHVRVVESCCSGDGAPYCEYRCSWR